MRISKAGLRLGLLVAAVLALSGCSFFPKVGVRLDESRQPVVEIARCSGERITSVELHDGRSSADPVIWRVESNGTALDAVTVGETPRGFVEAVPLADIVRSDTDYRVVVRGEGTQSEVFRPGELARDLVLSGREFVELDEFRSRAGGSCEAISGAWLAVIIILAVLAFLLWAGGMALWIVKLVQVARIPDEQYRAAGTDKTTWVIVVVLTSFVGALIWHFGPRRRVLAASALAPLAPPGWYPVGGGWLWWDGQRWLPAPPPPPGQPPPPPPE